MSFEVKKLKGGNGTLEIFEDRAIIHRTFMERIGSGAPNEKTMIYSKLSGVEFKKPSILGGYLQFTGSGLKASSGTMDASKNENTIMFRKDVAEWEKAAQFINDKIASGSNSSGNQQLSAADEILKYKSLLDSGIITDEEFQAKKKDLLGL